MESSSNDRKSSFKNPSLHEAACDILELDFNISVKRRVRQQILSSSNSSSIEEIQEQQQNSCHYNLDNQHSDEVFDGYVCAADARSDNKICGKNRPETYNDAKCCDAYVQTPPNKKAGLMRDDCEEIDNYFSEIENISRRSTRRWRKILDEDSDDECEATGHSLDTKSTEIKFSTRGNANSTPMTILDPTNKTTSAKADDNEKKSTMRNYRDRNIACKYEHCLNDEILCANDRIAKCSGNEKESRWRQMADSPKSESGNTLHSSSDCSERSHETAFQTPDQSPRFHEVETPNICAWNNKISKCSEQTPKPVIARKEEISFKPDVEIKSPNSSKTSNDRFCQKKADFKSPESKNEEVIFLSSSSEVEDFADENLFKTLDKHRKSNFSREPINRSQTAMNTNDKQNQCASKSEKEDHKNMGLYSSQSNEVIEDDGIQIICEDKLFNYDDEEWHDVQDGFTLTYSDLLIRSPISLRRSVFSDKNNLAINTPQSMFTKKYEQDSIEDENATMSAIWQFHKTPVSSNSKDWTSADEAARTPKPMLASKSSDVDAKLTKQKREECAEYWFRVFDCKIFEEKLGEKVQITWNSRLTKTAGQTTYNRFGSKAGSSSRQKCTIELSSKVLDVEHRVKKTLLHECCHAAQFILNKEFKPPHGPAFRYWARKASSIFPDLEVSTTHDYIIFCPHQWKCLSCDHVYGRHSNSIDTEKQRCGKAHCRGYLQYLGKVNPAGTPSRRKMCSAYNQFVKDEFERIKNHSSSTGTHVYSSFKLKEHLKEISQKWAQRKSVDTLFTPDYPLTNNDEKR